MKAKKSFCDVVPERKEKKKEKNGIFILGHKLPHTTLLASSSYGTSNFLLSCFIRWWWLNIAQNIQFQIV